MDRNRTTNAPGPPSQEPQLTGSGAYRLGERLSQSVSADVYLAEAVADGATVVVKQPTAEAEAAHEADILRRLSGDGAPVLLANDTLAGGIVLVIERLNGSSLLELVRDNAALAGSARFRRILDGVASALGALHGHGVLHGDLKPDHVIIDGDDEVRLIDFSAAVSNGHPPPEIGDVAWLTPGFAAPEQRATGVLLDARTDIFAFGATAFWAATGRVPPSPSDIGSAQSKEQLLRDVHLPDDLYAMIMACLRPRREERPHDAAILRDLLAGRVSVTSASAAVQGDDPDEVPATIRVRRRHIGTPSRTGAIVAGKSSRKSWIARGVMFWLFLLVVVAGTAAAGIWQGKPVYEKHFKAVWLIDVDGSGDATSMAKAAARAGDDVTFLLASGEHAGTILRNGVYRIRPADKDADPPVILAGPEGCLTVIDARLSLSGLIFREGGGKGDHACIEQSGGKLDLLDIVIENVSRTGIIVRGGASSLVADSELVSIGGDAIRVEGGSELELRDTKIVGAGGNAVTVESGARLTMLRTRIADTARTGLLLAQGAEARLEADVIEGGAATALEMASGARAEARDLKLTDSGGAGIFLRGESQLRMADSRVSGNKLSGIFIDGAARVDVEDSVITKNGEHGILSLGTLAGRLDRNEIGFNGGYGLVLDPATRVEIGDNVLDSNGTGPVMDARAAKGGGKTKENSAK